MSGTSANSHKRTYSRGTESCRMPRTLRIDPMLRIDPLWCMHGNRFHHSSATSFNQIVKEDST